MAGFECEFVEKPPKAVQSACPICLLILREPYQATCCGKSFCKVCIHRIKAANQACPTCNDKNFNLFHNKGLQQSLYDFQVYCTHKSKGCEWTGELRELDNHLNSDPPADKSLEGCPFILINCPLSCAGCEVKVTRKDIKAHINDKLFGHVMAQSLQIKVIEDENKTFQYRLQKVEEDKRHLERSVSELKAKISQLKGEVNTKQGAMSITAQSTISEQLVGTKAGCTQSGYPLVPVDFRMTDFEEYKDDDIIWHSPPFYTQEGGYKMCLRVDASNDSGTHVSIWIHLMRGEFDDELKWPFRGDVTVQLVNQKEENRGHHTHVINFRESDPATANSDKRITVGDRAEIPLGKGNFIPHTELQPKYLKNDCLVLRIKRVVIN